MVAVNVFDVAFEHELLPLKLPESFVAPPEIVPVPE